MPISTPKLLLSAYRGDEHHFRHVLDYLFIPAIEKAGLSPVSPKVVGGDVIHAALITASATLQPFSLSHYSSWRTERRWRYLDGSQNGGKQRAGLLPEKALRRSRAVRTREEQVVHRCEACPFSGVVESAQLMVA